MGAGASSESARAFEEVVVAGGVSTAPDKVYAPCLGGVPLGRLELSMTQIRAIEILLRKSIPDLAAAEIKSEQTHRYEVEIPAVLTSEQWLEKYGKCDKESDLPDKPDRPLH
jgi:hypothetical protein